MSLPLADLPAHPAWVLLLFEGYPTWITLPGAPHAKQRPRSGARRGWSGSRVYKPDAPQEASIAWQLRSQWRGAPLEGPVALYVRFWVPDARTRDVDNMLKALMDAGNQAGLWGDDRQVKALAVLVDVDRERPRTELAVGVRRG